MVWTKLTSVDKLPVAGKSAVYKVRGKNIVVFNVDGGLYASLNRCPHADLPIDESTMEGEVIECPWHGIQFDLSTGESPSDPWMCLELFELSIEGHEVQINLE